MITVYFIDGEMEGCSIAIKEPLPPSIQFPVNPHNEFGYDGKLRLFYDKLIYYRCGNTTSYCSKKSVTF